MTDNLPDNPARRAFGADVAPEIAYKRLPEVENQITECLQLSEAELLARLTINKRQEKDFLRHETLACLLFLAHRGNLVQIENQVAERLYASCEQRVRKFLKLKNFDENFIETAIGDIQLNMLEQVLERKEKSYDFWEVLFHRTLDALVSGYLHKHGEKRRATNLFAEMSDAADDDGDEADFESNLKSLETLTPDERVDLREVLSKLPEENRKIFVFHYGYGWTQEEIANTLDMTARTVRNRLKQINELTNRWRVTTLEGGEK